MFGIPLIGSWQISIIDILDIAIVTIIFYKIFRLIQGTRAQHMFFGLIVLILFAFLANAAQFNALGWIMSTFRTGWVVLIIILFQSEIRRGFTLLGRNRLLRLFIQEDFFPRKQEILEAVDKMSKKRTGALIVIQQDVGLKNYIEKGTQLQAKLNAELLISIFTVPSPLHDGAVIINKDEIVAAKCILPLSQRNDLPSALGTRHRAALGLAEETDAFIIVVSEESGSVSIARDRELDYNIEMETLNRELEYQL